MSGYRKRIKGNRQPCRIFVIVCEGTQTEPIYFNKYKTRYNNLTIEIPNTKCTDPKNLVEFAKSQINKYKLDLNNGDAVWCVFDYDENTNEVISKSIKIAGKKVKICFSNPNFELWFLLHFIHINHAINRSEVIEKLKKYIPDYTKSKNVFDILLDNRPDAIKNAKRLNEMHENSGVELNSVQSNPSTQVYAIVEEILRITENTK